jgi:hypothetical protein
VKSERCWQIHEDKLHAFSGIWTYGLNLFRLTPTPHIGRPRTGTSGKGIREKG